MRPPLVSLRPALDLGTWPMRVPDLGAWAEQGYPETISSNQEDFKLNVCRMNFF